MRPSIPKMAVVGLLLSLMVGGVSAQSSVDPTSDSEVFYPFADFQTGDSTVEDFSGNGCTGDVFGDPSSISGVQDDALGLDGSDYLEACQTDIGSGAFTVSTWVKLDSLNGDKDLVSSFDGSKGLIFQMRTQEGNVQDVDNIRIWIDGDSYITSIDDFNFGSWNHLLAVRESDGSRAIFINNNEQSNLQGGSSTASIDSSEPLNIGRRPDGSNYVDGGMDETMLLPFAVNSSQRTDLYNLNYNLNEPPSIDSVSTSPSSWTLGNGIDVSANVSDSDGSVSGVEASVFENGTEIVTDASLSDSDGDGTWEIDNLFTVDESDVYYNVTVSATDNDGATTTEEISQFIKDEPPEFNFSGLENKTYFQYSNRWTVDFLEDGDNVPGEEISCTTFIDGNSSKSFSGEEGLLTGSSNFYSDLGQHTFKVSCSDPAGNTKNKSVDYTVKAFKHTGLSADSSSFETLQEQFTFDAEVGNMVQAVDYNLVYSGETVETKSVNYSNDSVLSDQNSVIHEIGLVNKDNVDKKYNISADVTYDTLSGGNTSLNKVSSSNTQTVDQAYKFGNHSLEDGFTQLEASNLDYTAVLDLQTPDAQGTVSGTTTFNGTNNSLVKDGFDYSTEFTADLINSSSKAFPINTEYRLEFNGETRLFNDSKSLTLDRIEFSKDSSTGPESIKFKSKNEINDSSQSSALDIGLQAANPDRPEVQRFYGFEFSKDTSHSLYLSPSYADVKVNAFDQESLKYGNQEKSYPDRRYFLLDEVFDNQTSDVELFMLKEPEGLNVNLELLDSSRQQLSQHLIRVEKNIPSQETTRIVAMGRTGSSGTAKVFLDQDQQYIFSIFNSEGEFIGQIGPQSINVPETTLELTEEDTANFENLINEVRFTDVVLQNNSLKVDYISDTERLNNISLTVYRDGVFNNNKVASDSSTSLQSRLTVSGFNASNKRYFYELEGTFGEKDFVLSTQSFGQETSDYGNTGLLMSMLIITSLGIAGALVSFSAAIALTTLGVLVASPIMLGFLPIGQSGLIAIIALASIMIWRGTR